MDDPTSVLAHVLADWQIRYNKVKPDAAEIVAALKVHGFEITTRADTGPVATGQAHNLVIEQGDCEFYATCSCGKELGMTKPDQSFDVLGLLWERHVMTEVN